MTSGVSTFAQSLSQITRIKGLQTRFDTLNAQLASGKKTQRFSGLGSDILNSKRARADLKEINTYINNITVADRRLELTSTAISEFKAQADNFQSALLTFSEESVHQEGNTLYRPVEVTTSTDLSAFAGPNALNNLITASAPNLDPPNDRFEIVFSDSNVDDSAQVVTIDLSDAAAAAGGGNAQIELINYINAQITATGVNPDFNAQAVVGPGGTITLSSESNITIDNDNINGMSQAGLSALGFTRGSNLVDESLAVGKSSADIDIEFQNLRRIASQFVEFGRDLLNTRYDERYLFGGAETQTKPINNGSTLDTALRTQILAWKNGSITNSQLLADLNDRDPIASGNADAIGDSIVGFNAALSSGTAGDIFVRTDTASELNVTNLANDRGFRDMLVAAAFIANEELPPIADTYNEPFDFGDPVALDENGDPINGAPGASLAEQKDNFFAIVRGLKATTDRAMTQIDNVRFDLESNRARLSEIKDNHINERNVLRDVISDAEDVDLNEVAVQINNLQFSLEASYTVTARLQQLSLTNFI